MSLPTSSTPWLRTALLAFVAALLLDYVATTTPESAAEISSPVSAPSQGHPRG